MAVLQYPTELNKPGSPPVLIAQAYAFGKYLGHLEVDFDEDGDIVDFDGLPILLNNSFEQGKCSTLDVEPSNCSWKMRGFSQSKDVSGWVQCI